MLANHLVRELGREIYNVLLTESRGALLVMFFVPEGCCDHPPLPHIPLYSIARAGQSVLDIGK